MPWIWAAVSLQASSRFRLTPATRASAAFICSMWVLAVVTSASISFRYFEAALSSDTHLWPLCSRVTQSLQTTWPQSSSKYRYWSLCSGQKTGTVARFGFAFSSSRETTRWLRLALLRVWNPAAVLHMSSLQSKQQEVAGCCSPSQASQKCEPPSFVCWGVMDGACWDVAFIMDNNAKFFVSPLTPAGTEISLLQVGQLMVLPLSNLSRQPEQKLWPQLSRRGQRFRSSKRSQQIGHSSPSDAIVWKKFSQVTSPYEHLY